MLRVLSLLPLALLIALPGHASERDDKIAKIEGQLEFIAQKTAECLPPKDAEAQGGILDLDEEKAEELTLACLSKRYQAERSLMEDELRERRVAFRQNGLTTELRTLNGAQEAWEENRNSACDQLAAGEKDKEKKSAIILPCISEKTVERLRELLRTP